MSESTFRFTTNSVLYHDPLEYGHMNKALEAVGANVRVGPPIRDNEFWLPGPNTLDINYGKQEHVGIYTSEKTGLETGMEVSEAIQRYYDAFGMRTSHKERDS